MLLSFLCLLMGSCDMIDYHPYDVRINGETDVNAHNIAEIEQKCKDKTTIKFVTMGDSQRWYDETLDFVGEINKRDDIDFVIHGGDMSDFGVTDEFLWQRDIMNKLASATLALYSYDSNPDATTVENIMRQGISLTAKFPVIISHAYQAKRRYFDGASMFLHVPDPERSTAENILHLIRPDGKYTDDEAKLLDRCLILHAEHGGGNNSTFTVRVTTSSGTDTYSAIAAAVSSLKGPRHGGANLRVVKQFEEIKENVKNWKDEGEVRDYLCRILDGAAGDGSGLIYGMGHAIYTKSDPRAVALKHAARPLAEKKGMSDEMDLIELVEKLTPEVFAEKKGSDKPMCANVDMYSGFVYRMLGLPKSLYTPLFATARIVGWMAHRLEEVTTGGKIIRPAYKPLAKTTTYTNIDERR